MTSRGHRLSVVGFSLALALGLAGCGGGDDPKPKAKPTTTAGVTLTQSGEKLKFGKPANVTWKLNQTTTGLLSVAVDKVVEGTAADVARIQITPKPEDPHLYYVTVTVTNLGATDLGGQNVAGLGLLLDQGKDTLNPAAILADNMQFDLCPRGVLPQPFAKEATAQVCLVYVAGSSFRKMVFQPPAGDPVIWTGTVTKPAPAPAPTDAPPATPAPAPAPSAS